MQPTNRPGFPRLSKTVLAAQILVIAAWVVFFGAHAVFFGTLSIIHMAFAGLCCMLVFTYKNKGRIFCAMYHLIMAGMLTYQAMGGESPVILSVTCAVLFALSAILLLHPATARFYKKSNR